MTTPNLDVQSYAWLYRYHIVATGRPGDVIDTLGRAVRQPSAKLLHTAAPPANNLREPAPEVAAVLAPAATASWGAGTPPPHVMPLPSHGNHDRSRPDLYHPRVLRHVHTRAGSAGQAHATGVAATRVWLSLRAAKRPWLHHGTSRLVIASILLCKPSHLPGMAEAAERCRPGCKTTRRD